MGIVDLGRAFPVSHGDWASNGGTGTGGAYERLSIVRHLGKTWISAVETTEEPTIGATDWDIMAEDTPTLAQNVQAVPSGTNTETNVQGQLNGLESRKAPATPQGIFSALGYTPVQQGTGVGQLGNAVKIGWSGTELKATVDVTDHGPIKFKHDSPVDVTDPNFDTIPPGTYHVILTVQGSSPYPSNGILEVFREDSVLYNAQRYTTWLGWIFVRTKINNTWQPWQEVPHAGRLKTVGGQSLFGGGDIPIGLGVGQTWQDVLGSRLYWTQYTNTTGKPIAINVTANGAYRLKLYVNGITIYGSSPTLFTIIPNGATYQVDPIDAANTTYGYWLELR